MLDLSSLQKAVNSLEALLQRAQDKAFMDTLDDVVQNWIRAGVIQNFKFTFELCWKFIQRWIRLNSSPEDAEPRTRKNLFRMAARYGLISDPTFWFGLPGIRKIGALPVPLHIRNTPTQLMKELGYHKGYQ